MYGLVGHQIPLRMNALRANKKAKVEEGFATMFKRGEKIHVKALALLLSDGTKAEVWIDKTYNSFTIDPRGRKRREILCPSPDLMVAQKSLYEKLLIHVAPHASATAFFPGRNIGENARSHLGRPFLYKTDISNFFASVKVPLIRGAIEMHYPHLSQTAVEEIVALVTYENVLPQGAPTSPHLANLVLSEFDERLSEVSRRFNACYTRYADDIAVSASCNDDLKVIDGIVRSGLAELDLSQHLAKTRFLGPDGRKIVTGLDVSGRIVRPPRKYRKKVAALVRMCEVYPARATASNWLRIKGYLAHWQGVTPGDLEAKSLNERLIIIKPAAQKPEKLN